MKFKTTRSRHSIILRSKICNFNKNKQKNSLISFIVDSITYIFIKASIKLLIDNQKTITLIKNSKHHWCTKHIDVIKYHWIKKAVKNEVIKFKYISTENMIADGLTKFLRAIKFNKFLKMLKMLEWDEIKAIECLKELEIYWVKQMKCMQKTLKRAT